MNWCWALTLWSNENCLVLTTLVAKEENRGKTVSTRFGNRTRERQNRANPGRKLKKRRELGSGSPENTATKGPSQRTELAEFPQRVRETPNRLPNIVPGGEKAQGSKCGDLELYFRKARRRISPQNRESFQYPKKKSRERGAESEGLGSG
jgi:hypothetical protein